jgi:tetratricopeptide (TPR) repeat protein
MSGTGQKACLTTGIGLFIEGKDTEAVKRLEKAKDCKEKYIYIAFAFRRMREFDEAIKNLQKALDYEADTMNCWAVFGLAGLCASLTLNTLLGSRNTGFMKTRAYQPI